MASYTTTAKHALRRLTGGSLVNEIDTGIAALADDIDAKMSTADAGTLASRPVSTAGSPGVLGRFFRVTDQANRVDFDYGTGWVPLAAITSPAFTGTLTIDGDTNLYRPTAGFLRSDSNLGLGLGSASNALLNFESSTAPSKGINFGGDTNLFRGGPNDLRTDDQLIVALDTYVRNNAATMMKIGDAGGGVPGLVFGPLGDTNLYRSGASALKTDDALEVAGALTKGGVAVALTSDARLADNVKTSDARLADNVKTSDARLADNVKTSDARLADNVKTSDARLANNVKTDDARLGDQRYPVGPENLRTVRGTVDMNGSIISGAGFAVTKGAAGVFTLNYGGSFSSAPSITLAVIHQGTGAQIQAVLNGFPGTASAQVNTFDSVGFNNYAFSFIATGPA